MKNLSNSSTVGLKGHSTNRSPLFDRTNYEFWSTRMNIYMRSCDYLMWNVIVYGPFVLILILFVGSLRLVLEWVNNTFERFWNLRTGDENI